MGEPSEVASVSEDQLGGDADDDVDDDVEVKSCDSPIYCPGPFLDRIQRAKLFEDSKTFVDRGTKRPINEILTAFFKLPRNATRSVLKKFVADYFTDNENDLLKVELPDFNPNPPFLQQIKDRYLKGFASFIHGFWKTLTRRMAQDLPCEGCATSLIRVPRPFIIPGGRFKEIYYWDTYFVLEGLLLGDLNTISKDMILNFLDIVDEYGFMPNGARVYYLNRSQPPLLTQMVKIYMDKTKDVELLRRALPTLDKEYNYWRARHTVVVQDRQGKLHELMRYNVNNRYPRPESYHEDIITVEYSGFNSCMQILLLVLKPVGPIQPNGVMYSMLTTAPLLGWDYSTRFVTLIPKGDETPEEILRTLNTRMIIPVDLNSIMHMNEKILADFHRILERNTTTPKLHTFYEEAAQKRSRSIVDLLWDDKDRVFYDFNLTSHAIEKTLTPANYWPFWSGIFPDDFFKRPADIMKSFDAVEDYAEEYPGGIPITMTASTLQWDFPNSWPPLVFVAMKAITEVEHRVPFKQIRERLHKLAVAIAQVFINSTYCGWRLTGGEIPGVLAKLPNTTDSGKLFEKYDATRPGRPGGGGEYTVQDGFGWTNGVALWALNQFGKELEAPTNCAQIA
ncbi:glycoside hydrolase [Basidiobolus meristosporus CBS 931.73]|uniref:Trehalase n=1 Tax=Basidiobolus meristosporus CBS 931.73 TaxID=1314790 RepID=A0A1Y1YW94_9FUNG|nr:glycoside hydrolase [Basidiobolus meristosporus CBS 931.73]|eukprot:ORY02114.1 glycoside hydrolase [Basidiobolus meristosporus CBS 931.73]